MDAACLGPELAALAAAAPGVALASVAPAAFGGAAVAVAAGVKASHAGLVGFPLAAQFVLAGGMADTGGDLYFICDRRRRANEGEEVLEEERRRLLEEQMEAERLAAGRQGSGPRWGKYESAALLLLASLAATNEGVAA